jgi:drug/metabolite transporter (DMT)-like permease
MRSRTGYAELTTTGLLWGSIGVFVKHLSVAGATIVFFRLIFGWAVIVGYFAARRRLRQLRLRSQRTLLFGVGFMLALHWGLMFESFKRLDVATTILVVYVGPVFMALGAPIVLGERLERRTLFSLALSLGGIALIALPDAHRADAAGLVMAGGAALSYAALVLMLKRLTDVYDGATLMTWQLPIAAIALAPFLIGESGQEIVRAAPLLLVLGVVHTGLAGLLWFRGLPFVKAQHVGVIEYFEPASAVLYAWWLLDERPQGLTLLGGGLILIAGLNIVLGARARELRSIPPAGLPEAVEGVA